MSENDRQVDTAHMLEHHGLRKTAFRRHVLSIFVEYEGRAISHDLIEERLGDFDRITLYRTLKSFEEKGLIHKAPGQHGQLKYALCSHECDEDAHSDSHAHFHCKDCGNTICLEDVPKPLSQLVPMGYEVNEVQISFSGTCRRCN